MRILFYLNHTLYAKPLIPLIIRFAEAGARITIKQNTFSWQKYTPQQYSKNPTHNTIVNQTSIKYTAGLINYSQELQKILPRISFTLFPNHKKIDYLIGTTKNIPELQRIAQKHNIKQTYAIGYQHIPFLLNINNSKKWTTIADEQTQKTHKVFFGNNPFARAHKFSEIVKGHGIKTSGFPYLDKAPPPTNPPLQKNPNNSHALIFHPGGYRKVITTRGDKKATSYRKQKEFIHKICLPLIQQNLTPVIKAHPLAAIYHSPIDLEHIKNELSEKNPLFQKIIITSQPYWKWAKTSKHIITFGSSSIYELFSCGYKNVIIINWLGKERSQKFSFLTDITSNTYNQYLTHIKRGQQNIHREELTTDIFSAYSSLNKGNNTEKIYQNII